MINLMNVIVNFNHKLNHTFLSVLNSPLNYHFNTLSIEKWTGLLCANYFLLKTTTTTTTCSTSYIVIVIKGCSYQLLGCQP